MPSAPRQFPDALPREHPLDSLFHPSSVAVVGASDREGSVGRGLAENVLGGYAGTVHLVTPSRRTVLGHPAYPSLKALPGPVDLAVVCVLRDAVETVLEEGAGHGIKNYIVTAAGFGELDEAGSEAQDRMAALAAKHGLNIVGPNTVGLISRHLGLNATFASWSRRPSVPGGLAIVAQSGGFGSILHDLAVEAGLGIGYFVGSGNEMNLTVADYLSFAVSNHRVSMVWVYLEQAQDGRKLLDQIRALRDRGAPVLIVIGGRGQSGQRASLSHTGAVAGDTLVTSQLLRRAGAIVCDSAEEVLDIGVVLQAGPAPLGRRLAVMAHSGGIGVNAADLASENGLAVPGLSEALARQLDDILPPFVNANNPIDPTPAVTRDVGKLTQLLETVGRSHEFDALIVCGALGNSASVAFARIVAGALPLRDLPVYVGWSSPSPDVASLFGERGVPFFGDISRLFRALRGATTGVADTAALAISERAVSAGPAQESRSVGQDPSRAHQLAAVPEDIATSWLSDAGVVTVPSGVALSVDEAIELARKVGLPCVMKSVSPDVPHRSKVGAISLGVATVGEVAREYKRIRAVAQTLGASAPGRVLVQALITGSGPVEALVGVRLDSRFGPVLSVGMGGSLVEHFRDVQTALVPVDYDTAYNLVEDTAVLSRAVSPEFHRALAETVVRVSSAFAGWHDDQHVIEMDINPVVYSAAAGAALALDVLAICDTNRGGSR